MTDSDLTRLYLDSAQTDDELEWLTWDDWEWMVRDTWRHADGVQGYIDSAECANVGRPEDWNPEPDPRDPRWSVATRSSAITIAGAATTAAKSVRPGIRTNAICLMPGTIKEILP